MQLLRSYFKMVGYIVKNKYRCSKFTVLLDYSRLIIGSILFHKLGRKKRQQAPLSASIAGNIFQFFSYPQVISLFEEIFIAQQYKFDIELNQNANIIDCGSNIGLSILYFRLTFPNTPVIAFEPDKDAFTLLEKNIRRNRITNVTLHNVALTDVESDVQLFANKNGSFLNMSLFPHPDQLQVSETVTSRKLSSFINRQHTFIKIDTEGAEYAIIKDVIETGAINLIRQMIIECHNTHTTQTPATLTTDLQNKQFTCVHTNHPLFLNAPETLIYATQQAPK